MSNTFLAQLRADKDHVLMAQRKKDRILSRPILWYLLLTAICVFGRDSFLAPLKLPENLYHYIRYGATTIATLYALFFIKKKFVVWLISMEMFFGLSYLFAYIQGYMLRDKVILYTITTLIVCIPGAVSLASMTSFEYFYQRLRIIAFFVSIICLLYLFSPTVSFLYSMPASYQLLWCCSIHVNEIFKNDNPRSKVFYTIISIIEFGAIFIRGARGPLFCFAIYLASKIVIEMRYSVKAIVTALVGFIALATVANSITEVLNWIGIKLSQAGIYSRNLHFLIHNTVFDASGREVFHSRAIDLIWERPFLGYGASSDVKLLGGQYTHSLPLELMFDFGIVVGGIIFIVICIHVIRTFLLDTGIKRDLKLIFLTEGFVMLFFSGTYLQNIFFFMFIGVLLSEAHSYKITLVNRDRSGQVML